MRFIQMVIFHALVSLSTFAVSGDLQQLSDLLKESSAKGVILDKARKQRVEQLLRLVLPDEDYIGKDMNWEIRLHDMEENDFFQVDLAHKDKSKRERPMWLHILYKSKKPGFYGSEKFGKYRGMGMKDVHYFILVGHLEIRAVASSDAFKNDKKIKGMLNAFKLSEIEKL